MKILITGGAGFIASHIVDQMIKEGWQTVVVDNLSTGFLENLNPETIFYKADITNFKEIKKIFAKEKPDYVNHHAAQMSVSRSEANPLFDAKQNILGSINILVNCVNFGVKKIIYASSGGTVYGEPKSLPVKENHPVTPISPYGISKHTVEHYLYLYQVNYGLKWTILRYPNIYGPRQNPDGEAGVIAIFTKKLLNNENPVIYGTGGQTRDYLYIKDVVKINILTLKNGDNQIYNIGTGKETSVLKIFNLLKKLTDSKLKPIFQDKRPGEIQRISLEANKAIKELGWKYKYELKEGLKETIKYY